MHIMTSYYQVIRVFAAVLLCALLQYCTRDIPTPVPAHRNSTQQGSLENNDAASAAKEGFEAQPETIKVAAPGKSQWPTDATTASRLATCFDYYEVYYTNGIETGRTFLYKVCGGGDGSDGSGPYPDIRLLPNL